MSHFDSECIKIEAKNIDNKEAAVVSNCLEMSNHAFVYMNSGTKNGH